MTFEELDYRYRPVPQEDAQARDDLEDRLADFCPAGELHPSGASPERRPQHGSLA